MEALGTKVSFDKVNLGCETPKMRRLGGKFRELFLWGDWWGGRMQRNPSDPTLLSQALVKADGVWIGLENRSPGCCCSSCKSAACLHPIAPIIHRHSWTVSTWLPSVRRLKWLYWSLSEGEGSWMMLKIQVMTGPPRRRRPDTAVFLLHRYIKEGI